MFDGNGAAIDANIAVETKKTHDLIPKTIIGFFSSPFNFNYSEVSANESKPLHRAFLISKNGSFSDIVNNLGSGKYAVTANASINGINLTDWTTFEVTDWMASPSFFVLTLTLVSFLGLVLIIIFFNEGRPHYSELARFISISGIALLPITAFFLTDVEFGASSIAGLVYKYQLDPNGNILLDSNGQPIRQWAVNFGGDVTTNYRSGIQFPFYVFAFGLLGGYLRYLVKTFRKGGVTGIIHRDSILQESKSLVDQREDLWYRLVLAMGWVTEKEANKEFNKVLRTQFMRETLSELAELLLAPVLAIVTYFLLYQGSTPNIYTVAILSFVVGLVTSDFVELFEGFARRNLPGQEKKA